MRSTLAVTTTGGDGGGGGGGSTDDASTAPLKFAQPLELRADRMYAVGVKLDAIAKTRYGERGASTVRLDDDVRLTFLPCPSLSRNGSNVLRGQLPYFLYTLERRTTIERPRFSSHNTRDNEAHRFYILLMRLLANKLSIAISTSTLRDGGACRSLCSSLAAYATVYVETRPAAAFELIAAIDCVLPLISAASADAIEAQTSGDDGECSEAATRKLSMMNE